MCIQAGIKANEIDDYTIADLNMQILAHEKTQQITMGYVRQLCFHIARFGQVDFKKFPSSVREFMPFDWDEDIEEEDFKADYLRLREAKKKAKQKENNGS
jgi:hypothetical protein